MSGLNDGATPEPEGLAILELTVRKEVSDEVFRLWSFELRVRYRRQVQLSEGLLLRQAAPVGDRQAYRIFRITIAPFDSQATTAEPSRTTASAGNAPSSSTVSGGAAPRVLTRTEVPSVQAL